MGWRNTLILAAALWTGGSLGAHRVEAAFAHVVNLPADEANFWGSVYPDTQLNVYDGAFVNLFDMSNSLYPPAERVELNVYGGVVHAPGSVGAWGSDGNNIDVNVYGGVMGAVYAQRGVRVNVSGGVLGGVGAYRGGVAVRVSGGEVWNIDARDDSLVTLTGGYVNSVTVGNSLLRMSGNADVGELLAGGSQINISGGAIRSYASVSGSTLNVTGGSVGSDLHVQGATVNLSGGSTGRVFAPVGNRLNLYGGEFRLNGAPLALSGSNGFGHLLDLPDGGLLTGVLADGTPIALATQEGWRDSIGAGVLALHERTVPAAEPRTILAPRDAVPSGLRASQRLILHEGGEAPANFVAGGGSEVEVHGGYVGPGLNAFDGTITMSAGTIGEFARTYAGTVVTMSGGRIDSNLIVGRGSTVNLQGGVMGLVPEVDAGGVVNFAGGAIEGILRAHEGSKFRVLGGEFRLNGVPLAAASHPGAVTPLNLANGAVLSGTLADGTSFVLSDAGVFGNDLAAGTLTLEATELPQRGPQTASVPSDAAPRGLRTGQSVAVGDGGALPDHFTAGWGTNVRIDGGRVGNYFKAVGSQVTIAGGAVGGLFGAYYGSMVNISGGTIDGVLFAAGGSVVNVTGGTLDNVRIESGAALNVSGGAIGQYSYAYEGSVVNISGGSIGEDFWTYGATIAMSGGQIGDGFSGNQRTNLTLSGGAVGDEFANSGRTVLRGGDFRLNGAPIVDLAEYDTPTPIDVPAGWTLSGTLADGTPFAFSPDDGDNVSGGGGYFIQAWPTMGAGPAIVALPGTDAPAGVRSGQVLHVNKGGEIGDNFNAGWGSAVTINGGMAGRNLEAVGANVTMLGGTLGGGFDAMYGSRVSIAGGQIGHTSEERSWDQSPFTAHAGSVVMISGGQFRTNLRAEAGSEVHLLGTDFFLNGQPIAGLTPGKMVEILDRSDRPYSYSQELTGLLADGSPFRFFLEGISLPFELGDYFFSPEAKLTVTMALTADFTGDAAVAAGDLAAWRPAFGVGAGGDSDGDRDTDGADFLAWQRQLGRQIVPGAAAPEPASGVLLAAAVVVCQGAARHARGRQRRSWAYACASK